MSFVHYSGVNIYFINNQNHMPTQIADPLSQRKLEIGHLMSDRQTLRSALPLFSTTMHRVIILMAYNVYAHSFI